MNISNYEAEKKEGATRLNPAISTIMTRKLLSRAGSTKSTFHISLDIQGCDISFKPGDAVGIYPENSSDDVAILLTKLSHTNEIQTKKMKEPLPLEDFLKIHANLQKITQKLSDFLEIPHDTSHDVISAVLASPKKQLSSVEFCDLLLPITPRFYSIASSPSLHPNEIHLLVATFSYFHGNRTQEGLGSSYLCAKAIPQKTKIRFFIQPNEVFVLPEDSSRPLIMIGPGTGIAPFKAFLEHRLHQNANGKNWLFFGERNRHCDFYYEELLNSLHSSNFLKLTTAFSRDQEKKYYVQDAMLENSSELYRWIEEGAIIYICGDAKNMAKDVLIALSQIIEKEKSCSPEEASLHVKNLRKEGFLLQDVY
jgi:sulfite reductase (NADPH) flavoprotein alpha-component